MHLSSSVNNVCHRWNQEQQQATIAPLCQAAHPIFRNEVPYDIKDLIFIVHQHAVHAECDDVVPILCIRDVTELTKICIRRMRICKFKSVRIRMRTYEQ